MVTKADKNEMRISKHEEVCLERYNNIHENISDLKSRIKRLEEDMARILQHHE